MKKLIGGVMILMVLLAIALQPNPAEADADVIAAAAASITKGFGCGVINGNGGVIFTPDGRISVVTSSGHTTLICKANGTPAANGRAVVFRNFGCGTFLGFTTDSQNIVSASGKITLRCRI